MSLKHGALGTRLRDRLDELLPRVGKIEGDLRSIRDRDSQERASEAENDEVLQGLDEMTLAEIRQIREALKRIDDGSYGLCLNCRQPISTKRLAAVPTTVMCVECARQS